MAVEQHVMYVPGAACRIAPHVVFTLLFAAALPKLEKKVGL